jgi:hypothetical protein
MVLDYVDYYATMDNTSDIDSRRRWWFQVLLVVLQDMLCIIQKCI